MLPKADGSKIISMSLYGKDTTYTYGAIRNAQLTPIIYPGWKIRFYISMSEDYRVPERILDKLRYLGAELVTVTMDTEEMEPRYWRYLVADDDNVRKFIIRNAEARISDREKVAVDQWLKSSETLHVIKDHARFNTFEGLWGARTKELMSKLKKSMKSVISEGGDILQRILTAVESSILCHDSVTCTTDIMISCTSCTTTCEALPVSSIVEDISSIVVYER